MSDAGIFLGFMGFFPRLAVFDVGAGRQGTAPYNADIATGMD
ncbi:hypothetical protein [Pseudomonas sp. NFX15]